MQQNLYQTQTMNALLVSTMSTNVKISCNLTETRYFHRKQDI